MSKTILEAADDRGELLIVTAYVGRDGDPSVQLTIGRNYVGLHSDQVRALISALLSRLNMEPGFNATDP